MDADRIADRLLAEGVASLPDTGPVPDAAVHAVYARVLTRMRAWLPLVTLHARHADTTERVHAADLVGLVYAGAGVPRTNLAAAVRAKGGLLLVQGTEPAAPFGALGTAAEHDPSTMRQRSVLAAWVAGGEPALVVGGVGVGRESLARAAVPDADVVRDVEDLDPLALAALLPRLEPPVLRRGGTRGARPRGRALDGLVGEDARFCAVLADALRVAPGALPVLILGETGTGKEPLARLLHDESGRRGPFVAVDLSSRNSNLVDDDLFGHVPGAFEGARTTRDGAIRRAHRGTLFLDELGNLPLALQQKLLRVLERGEVQPLGSDALHPVDVRVVAATNADIEGMVRAGTFRADLYHRLAGMVLRPPPLRERGDDVVLLAGHFAERAGTTLAADAAAVLLERTFPGNVRELSRVIEAAALHGGPIRGEHLREARNPCIVTATGELGNLPRRLAVRLQALQISLAPPAERGPACLRNAIAFGLPGRPVTAAAVRALCEAPWWGNFHEIDRKLAAIRALPPGPVDAPDIARLFPIAVEAREPIVTVLHPHLREDGGVGAFVQRFSAGALVVGRARGRSEMGQRAAWVRDLTGDASLAWLALPHPPELSRVHFVVRREAGGLGIEVAPDAALPVEVESLDGPRRMAGNLGRAARVRIARGDEPVVDLWIFLGEDWSDTVARHLSAEDRGLSETFRGGPRRAWCVEATERELLLEVVLRFLRGDREFAPVLREALSERPELADLRAYLASSNPTQSFARLLQNPANEPLRRAVREALVREGLVERAKLRLPSLVRAALGPLG